jgi:hypothetical protein
MIYIIISPEICFCVHVKDTKIKNKFFYNLLRFFILLLISKYILEKGPNFYKDKMTT